MNFGIFWWYNFGKLVPCYLTLLEVDFLQVNRTIGIWQQNPMIAQFRLKLDAEFSVKDIFIMLFFFIFNNDCYIINSSVSCVVALQRFYSIVSMSLLFTEAVYRKFNASKKKNWNLTSKRFLHFIINLLRAKKKWNNVCIGSIIIIIISLVFFTFQNFSARNYIRKKKW